MWKPYGCVQCLYTAKKILTIIYAVQISIAACCRTEFDNIQTRALLSQVVVVGKILSLEPSTSSRITDFRPYTAIVQVLSVEKDSDTNRNSSVLRKNDRLRVDGFLKALDFNQTRNAETQRMDEIAKQFCLSYLEPQREYILFINRTASFPSVYYKNAQTALEYSKNDKKLIKDVLCANCAKAPNAKAKRQLEVTNGTTNFRITCRVEGNPPPDVRWFKEDSEIMSSTRGINIKFRRRHNESTLTLRIRTVLREHAGNYKCLARSILGEDTAKTKLTVVPGVIPIEVVSTPSSAGSEEEQSHYIACSGRDTDYCLHGGECRILRDGRYKHCRCLAKFTGARCEEANILLSSHPDPNTGSSISEKNMELVTTTQIITALVCILSFLVILLLFLAFYCAGWHYSRRRRSPEMLLVRHQLNGSVKESDVSDDVCKRVSEGRSKPPLKTLPLRPIRVRSKSTQTCKNMVDLDVMVPDDSKRYMSFEDIYPRYRSACNYEPPAKSQPAERKVRERLSALSYYEEETEGDSPCLFDHQCGHKTSITKEVNRMHTANSGSLGPSEAYCDEDADIITLHISESDIDGPLTNSYEPPLSQRFDLLKSAQRSSLQIKDLRNGLKMTGI